ncbi:MAG: bifunctional 3-(3-hydroxy-phenyl)propionate/3-hydroxycinnamic acid hydroxylase [Parvibaculum sp.]|nr:bifunctional 3-(3-hydroxy-phenyl)propionate/3-hydroxycinnamic acid hydroxylase [Parvibaculum sp.]
MAARVETDVLIAGLGPVGAMLALLLARSGLTVTVVERDSEVYPLPRAAHIDHEVMRLLHLVGAADPVLKASSPLPAYEFRNGAGALLMGFSPGVEDAPTGFPPSSMFHQPTLEHGLRAAIANDPRIDAHINTALTTFTATDDGVIATITDAQGPREVRAKFLVGCDGGASVVRKLSQIALDDLGFDEPWLVIDTVLKNNVQALSAIGLQHCDPRRPVTSMPMGPGRHRWEFMMLPGETADDVMSDEALNRLVAPYADPASLTIERRAVYRFHAVSAQSWRKSRVLLCGDAAHQMPPFMGQGLCSGIRDAANLAWKIAAVHKGEAAPSLLDTYQSEREPHVRAITDIAVFLGRIVCVQNVDEAAARDAQMTTPCEADRVSMLPPLPGLGTGIMAGHASAGQVAPAPRLCDGRRLDDVIGYVPFLITREKGLLSGFAAQGRIIALSEIDDAAQHWSKLLGDNEAILVRPDRFIFGLGATRDLLSHWDDYLQSRRAA